MQLHKKKKFQILEGLELREKEEVATLIRGIYWTIHSVYLLISSLKLTLTSYSYISNFNEIIYLQIKKNKVKRNLRGFYENIIGSPICFYKKSSSFFNIQNKIWT